jgi:hypothetical protein
MKNRFSPLKTVLFFDVKRRKNYSKILFIEVLPELIRGDKNGYGLVRFNIMDECPFLAFKV